MASTQALQAKLAALRLGFDRSFSLPVVEAIDDLIDLVMIRVGRDPYALRLAQLAALESDRTITPLPSEHAELLGIAGVRGTVVAVFDLALLFGLGRPEATRWLVLAKGAPLAFAFGTFERLVAVRPHALARAASARSAAEAEIVVHDGVSVPLIDLSALVAGLERRARRVLGEG
jgi:chemotaxis signal transduction protein